MRPAKHEYGFYDEEEKNETDILSLWNCNRRRGLAEVGNRDCIFLEEHGHIPKTVVVGAPPKRF